MPVEHPLLLGPAGSERHAAIHQHLQVHANWRATLGDSLRDRRCNERKLHQARDVALPQSLTARDLRQRRDRTGRHFFEPGTRPRQSLEEGCVDLRFPGMAVQDQPQFSWPPSFALARAYVDQLERANALPAARIAAVRTALTTAEKQSASDRRTSVLASLTAGRPRSISVGHHQLFRGEERQQLRALGDDRRKLVGQGELLLHPVEPLEPAVVEPEQDGGGVPDIVFVDPPYEIIAEVAPTLFGRLSEVLAAKPDALVVGQAGEVMFERVWFRYGKDWTLQDVSFTVPSGTTTALVGETGSGKTTLGYLAARLYDVSRGSITIGGVDIRDLSFQALTDLIGVVSQETYLFHESVRENLRFAKPDATDEEVEEAARAAQIHELIATLPEGYDTVVGERGYRFSGGEKQRIAIARTILRNPPILVLDEATSSLDTETERLVQEALDQLSAGRTTIAIAHRLSTVRDADQIIVLDHGRVVESGRHEDLILAGGRYTTLATRDADLGAAPALREVPELAGAGEQSA